MGTPPFQVPLWVPPSHASKWLLFHPNCINIATFLSKMLQNCYFSVQNASNLLLFRPKCVKIATLPSNMRQNCNFSFQNASKLLLLRPKCVKIATFPSKMHQNLYCSVQNASKLLLFREALEMGSQDLKWGGGGRPLRWVRPPFQVPLSHRPPPTPPLPPPPPTCAGKLSPRGRPAPTVPGCTARKESGLLKGSILQLVGRMD